VSSKSSLPVWVALLGSGFAGALIAVQTRINGGLSNALHDGYVAAAYSFGSGLLIMVVAMLLSPRARKGLRLISVEVRSRRMPWWVLLGGLCGGFFVLGQGTVATVIGLALFTVGVVAGQVSGGLLFDRMGLGPGGRIDPTATRMVGTVLAIVAVVLSVLADLGGPDSHAAHLWLIVVPLCAGLFTAWQSAMNGLVRAAAQSAIASTFINFVFGMALLTVAATISVAIHGWPQQWPTNPVFYVGGILGAIFIALAVVLVRTAGVLLLSMSNVAGQLIAAVALEAWLPLSSGVTPWLLAGAAVALVAVIIAALPSRRVEARSQRS
jgi:transporter family-2 protein